LRTKLGNLSVHCMVRSGDERSVSKGIKRTTSENGNEEGTKTYKLETALRSLKASVERESSRLVDLRVSETILLTLLYQRRGRVMISSIPLETSTAWRKKGVQTTHLFWEVGVYQRGRCQYLFSR
jgi:hypothetical protein